MHRCKLSDIHISAPTAHFVLALLLTLPVLPAPLVVAQSGTAPETAPAPSTAPAPAAPPPTTAAPAAATPAPAPTAAPAPSTATPAPAAPAAPAPAAPEEPPPPPPPTLSAPPTLNVPPPAGERLSEKLSLEQAKEDSTALNLSAGGSLNTGNTNAYTLLVGGDFALVRRPHAFTANAAFAYGRAKLPAVDTDRMLETVKNLNARAKYQFFLSAYDVLVLATGFRWDPFAGIARRNNGQAGYGRYFIIETKHRFWGELGVDITGTKYSPLPVTAGMEMGALRKTSELVYFGRVFLGYENQLNESVSYVGGFEGLVNLQEPGASRINWDNALRSTLSDAFKLELRFRLAYDAKPVVIDAKKLDTATVVSILYSML